MGSRCAVFSCLGLGDGLISFILSNNLSRQGFDVTTFHPFLSGMRQWFPSFKIQEFPKREELEKELKGYDRFFIFFEKSPAMTQIIEYCNAFHLDKTLILNPIATKNRDYLYWGNGKFDGSIPFADNMEIFCRQILKLKACTKENGITPLSGYQQKKFPTRIALHPTSSRQGKNWPKEKFFKLAQRLKKKGFDPYFILTKEERDDWTDLKYPVPRFSTLTEIAQFVYESGYMIGNDSGIGHLASCLGIPTITICRNQMTSSFWRPSWTKGVAVHPPKWIPNIKGLRWRDRYWKKWIFVSDVLRAFDKLGAKTD